MKRNRHIGFRYLKWQILSIPFIFMCSYVCRQLFEPILSIFPDPLFTEGGIKVTHEFVVDQAKYLWDIGIRQVLTLCVIAFFIENVEKTLSGLSLISKNSRAVSIAGDIISLPIYLYAAYLGLYQTAYLEGEAIYNSILNSTDDENTASIFAWAAVLSELGYVLIGIGVPFMLKLYVEDTYRFFLAIKDHPVYQRLFVLGFGGSAAWAHVLDFEKRKANCSVNMHSGSRLNSVYLGKSLFDDDPFPRPIEVNDDTHMVTIGMTGSGKSTTVLYPNLAMYDGRVYVVDPKGELAKNTYRRRCSEEDFDSKKIERGNTKFNFNGHHCYCLDPYEETNGEFPYDSFNPLFGINLDDNRSTSILNAISDGCIIHTGKGDDAHWSEWSRSIIEGLIVHVISRYPKEDHNLPFILDLLSGSAKLYYEVPEEQRLNHFDELLVDMMTNDAFGGLPQQVASRINGMGENERGSVLSTTYRNLKWVGEPAMRDQLTTTTIDSAYPDILITEYSRITVYIVLPTDMISSQVRWLRVLTGVFLSHEKKVDTNYKFANPTLFMIDEFGQLGGNIEAITKGFPVLRGFNVKLWLFAQSISQLKHAFTDKWTDIISASTVQVFGVNDSETSEWVSKRLGSRLNTQKKKKMLRQSQVLRERIAPLLSPDEVEYMLGKGSNLQIVFPTKGRPMRLERTSYKPLDGFNKTPFDLKGHFEDY